MKVWRLAVPFTCLRFTHYLCQGRLLQLEIAEEIDAERSCLQRSKVSGNFVATMPRWHSTATERLTAVRCFSAFRHNKIHS